MEPEIYDGDKVLFAEGVEAGERDIVVISCRNRLFIKGIKSMTERSIVLGHLIGRFPRISVSNWTALKETLKYWARF